MNITRFKSPRGSIGRARANGFTLVELMLVIIIIGVLAAMVVPSLVGRSQQARVTAANADIRAAIGSALDVFEMDTGAYPTTSQGLEVLLKEPDDVTGWRGPYLKETKVPVDPWGNEYVYKSPGEHEGLPYDLVSYGKDGKEGGDDDIANYGTDDE